MFKEFTHMRSYPIQRNVNVLESDVLEAIKMSLPSELARISSTVEVPKILGKRSDRIAWL